MASTGRPIRALGSSPLLALLAGCAPLTTVEREVGGAWSTDGSEVLVVKSRYRTSDPDEPWFNTTKARDWWVVFERADADLGAREEVGGWDELTDQGGGIGAEPQFWVDGVVVGTSWSVPYLLDTRSGARVEPLVPHEALVEAVGAEAAEWVSPRQSIPSPDGQLLATSMLLATSEGDWELELTHLVAFHALPSGDFLSLVRVDFSESVDLRLVPPQADIPFLWTHLWAKDSRGVYLIGGGEAFLASVDGSVSAVSEVPARAVPTRGGCVSDAGVLLRSVEEEGNQAWLEEEALQGWVRFDEVEQVPVEEITYAAP